MPAGSVSRVRIQPFSVEVDPAVILSGKFGGSMVAYLGTGRDLGIVLDTFSGIREGLD